MIAKIVGMRLVKKSSFAELTKYLTDEQEKSERVGFVNITNCNTSNNVDVAVLEIVNTQELNTRSETDKTFHLIVSFPAGEQPADTVLKEIEGRICEGLGFGEHQRVSVVHHDTDNTHIHIAINKIHPTRYTIHEPYYGKKTLGALCEKLEQEYGLEKTNHTSKKFLSEGLIADMERHSGVESLVNWIRREGKEKLQAAGSWEAFHRVLSEHGLLLKERGNGFIFTNHDGITVKASTVAREFSKEKLIHKFGLFKPDSPQKDNSGQRYQMRPIHSGFDTSLLFAQYMIERKAAPFLRSEELKRDKEKKAALIADAKRVASLKRSVIKLADGSRAGKRISYALVSHTLLADIKAINERFYENRLQLYKMHKPLQWADWLRVKATQGDGDALAALRARRPGARAQGNGLLDSNGHAVNESAEAIQDSITKNGTIIYKVGGAAVRDDGAKLSLSRAIDQNGLVTALEFAKQRYGDRIHVNGTADFKAKAIHAAVAANLQITFADATLERYRQTLTSTFKGNNHEPRQRTDDGGRTGSSFSPAGPTAARHDRGNTGSADAQPNINGFGRTPPPAARGRLRNLSEIDVVRFADRNKVLLPGDVSDHVEHNGAHSDRAMRWPVAWRRLDEFSVKAALQYINEREEKRTRHSDIMTHRLYNESDFSTDAFEFHGIRVINDRPLVLLKQNDEIIVMPITDEDVSHLKRHKLGDNVSVVKGGVVHKARGRSR